VLNSGSIGRENRHELILTLWHKASPTWLGRALPHAATAT
jgi:hypothetical protein